MKLSIIIPVYNVESYLDSCLQSILEQGLDDYEVILVDDCSPDKCGHICDEWANMNENFKVVHRESNGGLSVARNEGIQIATGDYITFVDSDDFLGTKSLREIMSVLNSNADIDVLEYPIYVYYGGKKAYIYIPGRGDEIDYADWICSQGYIHSFACNKIYKRTLWEQIRFPERMLMEDLFTIPYVLKKSKKIFRSDLGIYYYCDRKGSISNTINLKSAKDFLEANLKLYNELSQDERFTEQVLDDLYIRLCNAQIVVLQLGGDMSIPQRNIPIKRTLFVKRSKTLYVKALLMSLMGYRYCRVVASIRNMIRRII